MGELGEIPEAEADEEASTDSRLREAFEALGRVVDPLSKVVNTVAVVVAGVWAYNLFVAEDTHEFRPEFIITAEVLPYTADTRLLNVNANLKNKGKVRITVKRDHFWMVVKKIPGQHAPGYLNIEQLPDLYKVADIANVDGGYELEPDVTYHEQRSFIVPPGTYAAYGEADYDDKQGEEVDDLIVVQVK